MKLRVSAALTGLLAAGLTPAGPAHADFPIYTATTRYVIDGQSSSYSGPTQCEKFPLTKVPNYVAIAAPPGGTSAGQRATVLKMNRDRTMTGQTDLPVITFDILIPGQEDIGGVLAADDGTPALGSFNRPDWTFTYTGHTTPPRAPHTVELQMVCMGFNPSS